MQLNTFSHYYTLQMHEWFYKRVWRESYLILFTSFNLIKLIKETRITSDGCSKAKSISVVSKILLSLHSNSLMVWKLYFRPTIYVKITYCMKNTYPHCSWGCGGCKKSPRHLSADYLFSGTTGLLQLVLGGNVVMGSVPKLHYIAWTNSVILFSHRIILIFTTANVLTRVAVVDSNSVQYHGAYNFFLT